MTKADALRALIDGLATLGEVEELPVALYVLAAQHLPDECWPWFKAAISHGGKRSRSPGSLDAVARLEAPLRARGCSGPHVIGPDPYEPQGWVVRWFVPQRRDPEWYVRDEVEAEAPTEARARLLAVLRALLWEAEQSPSTPNRGPLP